MVLSTVGSVTRKRNNVGARNDARLGLIDSDTTLAQTRERTSASTTEISTPGNHEGRSSCSETMPDVTDETLFWCFLLLFVTSLVGVAAL